MAAYEAVISLKQDLHLLLNSYDDMFVNSSDLSPFKKEEIESLHNDICFMDSIFIGRGDNKSYGGDTDKLEKQIRGVVKSAGFYIDAKLWNFFFKKEAKDVNYFGQMKRAIASLVIGTRKSVETHPILQEIREKIRRINKELSESCDTKIDFESVSEGRDENSHGEHTTSTGMPSSFIANPLRRSTIIEGGSLVGRENQLLAMLDDLTGQPSRLKVFAVVGMAGIGKTTFAQKLYNDPLVMHRFDIRAWVTVSQQYQLKTLLLHILRCVTSLSDDMYWRNDYELKEQLYKNLKGKRYLIVLDDMWDNKVWDDLKRALSKLEMKVEVWKQISQSVTSLVMNGHTQDCNGILALSYNHLPDHLKTCFLYMGMFPADFEISVEKLIWLWIAEGFIRPTYSKSLEEVGETYMEDLVARSLVLVKRRRPNGRIKICFIHDLIRELCLRESKNQSFFHIIDQNGQLPPVDQRALKLYTKGRHLPRKFLHKQRRLSFHSSVFRYISNWSFLPFTRSFLCFETIMLSDPHSHFMIRFKLVQVLDIMHVLRLNLSRALLEMVHLRYLALTIENSLNLAMFSSKLRNLQTCIIDCEWDGHLPNTFWDMSELRHFHLKRRNKMSCLPNHDRHVSIICLSSSSDCMPASFISEEPARRRPLRVLHNLQTLSRIRPISCTQEIFLSMPNLKKLEILETKKDHRYRGWFRNIMYLRKLETLKYAFGNPFGRPEWRPDRLPSPVIFPPLLTKLSLSGTSLPWEDMLKLSKLPKLEILKLRNYAFSGVVWNQEEGGGFCNLKFLLIGSTNLEKWEMTGEGTNHFASLQHLVLMHCKSLMEIPYGIGEAPLLEKIELHRCVDSVEASAWRIQQEQQDLGNDGIAVLVFGRLRSAG